MSVVLLTDYAWPDTAIERSIIEGAGHRLVTGPSKAGSEQAIEELVALHRPAAIMTCWAPVSARAIGAAQDLRIVARMGVGLDNIAVAAATAAGAWVTNVPDYCVEEVSDHALALVLAWARGIAVFDRAVKDGRWDPAGARLRRLRTLTVGIVGYGRIGRATAAKLAALGVRVLAHDVAASPEGAAELVSLDVLLAAADAVILHLPLTAATRHFVDARLLAKMKPDALLVNVSRGPIVDSSALLAALRAGSLAGAALDVVEGEPEPPLELVGHPGVIATPHVAFSSLTAVRELRERASAEVVRVLSGEPPRYACNLPAAPSR
jgi:D-3-phosphoglycerate dehydrogenase